MSSQKNKPLYNNGDVIVYTSYPSGIKTTYTIIENDCDGINYKMIAKDNPNVQIKMNITDVDYRSERFIDANAESTHDLGRRVMSMVQNDLKRGGRRTRRNKLRKKRRKTNRKKTNRRR